MLKKFIINKEYHNSRFDRWFRQNVYQAPQSFIEKLTRKKNIKVNKKKIKSSYRVQSSDIVEIYGLEKFKASIKLKVDKYLPSKKEKDDYSKFIIEDNDNFIVINKPCGIPVQSGTKSFRNIIDILKNTKYFDHQKPYIVHRLDKETSGVMIIAKNRQYAQLFTSLFRIRKIHKTYLALTHGKVNKNINILRDNLTTYENNKKITQKAISYLKILKSNNEYSFLELKPVTGRKHQLRKQLYNIGNPVIGDDKYKTIDFNKKVKPKNLMLHAFKLKFMIKDIKYSFQAKYRDDFDRLIKSKF